MDVTVKGINYKPATTYASPKILIRQAGIGVNAILDTALSMAAVPGILPPISSVSRRKFSSSGEDFRASARTRSDGEPGAGPGAAPARASPPKMTATRKRSAARSPGNCTTRSARP